MKIRTKENIIDIVKDCACRLLYDLQFLVSDGFKVNVGVARALNKNLTHIRHINKPPYGRIIIEVFFIKSENDTNFSSTFYF
ncbi:hypothetical protein [Candidatus Harpocratesius sp.]